MFLGVCVGQRKTNAVVGTKERVLAKVRIETTEDIKSGVDKAINHLLVKTGVKAEDIEKAALATIQVEEAIKTREKLGKVALIRLSKPEGQFERPLIEWPKDLAETVLAATYVTHGGHEINGRIVTPINEGEIKKLADEIKNKADAVVLSSPFSPLYPEHEIEACDVLRAELGPDFPVTKSHEIGGMGIAYRENAATLNGALVKVICSVADEMRQVLGERGIEAPFYLLQNNGMLMSADFAKEYPILTVFSEFSASLMGAGFLAMIENGAVAKIEEHRTRFGLLNGGFPAASEITEMDGFAINSRVPTMSIIEKKKDKINRKTIENTLNLLKANEVSIPLVLTGEDIPLVGRVKGFLNVVKPRNMGVADAIGVLTAGIGAEVNRIFPSEIRREDALKKLENVSKEIAVKAGAAPATVKIVKIGEAPAAVLPAGAVSFSALVIGETP